MYIFQKNGDTIEFGRVNVERKYDDFTQPIPNWLELVNSTLTENVDTNAVLSRITSGSNMKLQTKIYNLNNLNGILM